MVLLERKLLGESEGFGKKKEREGAGKKKERI